MNVSVQNQMNQIVTFNVPLEGFTAGFDGEPIDPEELEQQQRQLQEELQRRSDEMRGTAAPGSAVNVRLSFLQDEKAGL